MKAPLAKYQAMRDFRVTAEPSGKQRVARSQRLRFVIQKHEATRLHYDFRLEWDGTFHSWAVTRGPSLDPGEKRLAVAVEDHPLDYGDFEGSIPKGQYGGGTVMLWDRGFWVPDGDIDRMFAKGELKFTLEGEKLHGSWVLVRMRPDKYGNAKRNNWLLIKHQDKFAKHGDGDNILKKDHSVASGRAMKAIAAGTGKRPKPFMRAKGIKANAVWPAKGNGGGKMKSLGLRSRQDMFPPCPASSRRSSAASWSIHRPARTGCMKSNSMVIACNCGWRTARHPCAPARAWTGRPNSPPSRGRRQSCRIA